MASLSHLEVLNIDTTCAICLDHLQDPVMIPCGHSFCRVCITQYWKPVTKDFSCPTCRHVCVQQIMYPNRQLASIVETARQLPFVKEKMQNEKICYKHHEVINLFCKEDQEAMCVVCAVSHGHLYHTVGPLDEVLKNYKEKLQSCLEDLGRKAKDLKEHMSMEEKKPKELRELVRNCHKRITCDFEELRSFLEQEKDQQLHCLRAEETEILGRLKTTRAHLSEQCCSLNTLIVDMERCLESRAGVLKDMQSVLQRYETFKNLELPSVSVELKRSMAYFPRPLFHLKKMLKKYTGDVTLDPQTAHPNLVLSENLKSVYFIDIPQELPHSSRRFTTYPCVLGSSSYSSGRHYWEVEVGNKTHWALGVCYESASSNVQDPKQELGYWRVRLWNEQYVAMTTPFTPLLLNVKPKRVGIFLDYEAGKVSFYNMTNRSHIYTFDVIFAEAVCPLFYPGVCIGDINADPLSICEPSDWY
ncbi:PREDICTED: E3 ubiquitin-protein ligase TRIM39-like [Tinamus guttatus]|nr:PREDICTED: E3 ubiquitin-protein ligase TRIM39-like [Tinamus guttatus]